MLEFNKPLQIAHIQFLQNMAKDGTFTYVGRKDEPVSKFYSGDCGIITNSSGSLATIKKYAKFNFGTGMMPYDASVKGAPQNAIIGGASLWVSVGQGSGNVQGRGQVPRLPDVAGGCRQVASGHRLSAGHDRRVSS